MATRLSGNWFGTFNNIRLSIYPMGNQFGWHLSECAIDGTHTHTPQRLASSVDECERQAVKAMERIERERASRLGYEQQRISI